MGDRSYDLVGRLAELDVEQAFLDSLTAGPSALVLAGDAGIGKTALWQLGLARARERGYAVLECGPDQEETQLGFAALGDLLVDLDPGRTDLPVPQRRALDAALLRVESDTAYDWRAAALGFLGVVRSLVDEAPVVVGIDDVQWLDAASRRVLKFALRRLRTEPVGILLTVRGDAREEAAVELLGAVAESNLRALHVAPLGLREIDQLLRNKLSLRLSLPELKRALSLSGGNPFFAQEIGRAIARSEIELSDDSTRLPYTLQGFVKARIAALSGPTLEVLRVAAASPRSPMTLVEAVIGNPESVSAAVAEAEEAEVASVDRGHLSFTHPLLAWTIHSETSIGQRRSLHRRLAELVSDDEERARHLARASSGPDPGVAGELARAALTAFRRGAPDVAVELAVLAYSLTPRKDAQALFERALELADYRYYAGDVAKSSRDLSQLLEGVSSGPSRAEILWRLAWFTEYDIPTKARMYSEALEHAGNNMRARAFAHCGLAIANLRLGSFPACGESAASALVAASALNDIGLQVRAATLVGLAQSAMGKAEAAGAFERAASLEKSKEVDSVYDSPNTMIGMHLMWTDELDAAREKLESQRERAHEQGDENSHAGLLIHLTELEVRAGRWITAARHASEAYEIYERIGGDEGRAAVSYAVALADAHLSRLQSAHAAAADGLELARRTGDLVFQLQNASVLGFLELSRDEPVEANRYLEPLPEMCERMGVNEPGVFQFHPNTIQTLVSLGRVDDAESLLTRFENRAQELSRAWAVATGRRCRGIAEAARGNLGEAEDILTQAIALHDALPYPFERARTLLAAGSLKRRVKKKASARDMLGEALQLFEQVGAEVWANHTRAELGRIGGRAPSRFELTPTENDIAQLTAQGLTNREIAERMFLSSKTVESNLSRVYRKLGIRSRTELAHLASQGKLIGIGPQRNN